MTHFHRALLPLPLVLALLATPLVAHAQGTPPPPATAQPAVTQPASDSQPTAREVLARSIEAMGGKEALDAIESIHFSGTFSMPAQGLSGSVEAWEAPPDRMLVRAELGGLGTIETGQAGGIGWSIDPMQGPRLLSRKELDQARVGQTLLRTSDPMDRYAEAEVDGRETFEGHDTWRLRLVMKDGAQSTGWYDVETGRQVGFAMTQVTMMGEIPVTIVMEDYRAFGPLSLPTRTVNRMTAMGMGVEQVLTIDTVEIDPESLPDFEPPPSIQALLPEAE